VRSGEVQALLDRADEAIDSNRLEEAIQLYRRAQRQAEADNDPAGRALAFNNASLHIVHGAHSTMLHTLEQAVALWHAQGDESGEAVSLNNIAKYYAAEGEMAKAQPLFERAVDCSGKTATQGD
jgi:tetratricopeptide (TPR) repeat protein